MSGLTLGYKLNLFTEIKFIININVKMPTIAGILSFISMINATSEFETKKNQFFSILIF